MFYSNPDDTPLDVVLADIRHNQWHTEALTSTALTSTARPASTGWLPGDERG